MIDLNDMYLFAKVAEHGGYNAAARAMGEQPSRLSRRVSALEEALGARLLNRTTRKISLTEAGRGFLERCQALAREADAARRSVELTLSEPSGLARVSCPPGLLHSQVAAIASRFLIKHPKARLKIEATNRRVDVIQEGFDAALRVRFEPMEDSELAARSLGVTRASLVGAPSLIDRLGEPSTLADLARYPTLDTAHPKDRRVWLFEGPSLEPERFEHEPRLEADDFPTLLQAALAGVGIARLPNFLTREALASGALRALLPELSCPTGSIYAVFPSRRGATATARAFLDELSEGFGASGPAGL